MKKTIITISVDDHIIQQHIDLQEFDNINDFKVVIEFLLKSMSYSILNSEKMEDYIKTKIKENK
jgi:hypothetical protein